MQPTTDLGIRRLLPLLFAQIAIQIGFVTPDLMADPIDIVRVEEEWELRAGEPDADVGAPHTSCVISPFGDVSQIHAVFNLNHQTLPDFVAGGMQLQVWNGGTLALESTFVHFRPPPENTCLIST